MSNNSNISNNSLVGILGYGEVGQAIAKFYHNPKVKDLNRDDGLANVNVLHVCIPWSNNFHDIVCREIAAIRPNISIIHSTVAVGATKKLCDVMQSAMIVHSPIRGAHPHLYEGVKTFIKYIGAENEKAGLSAQEHLTSLGIKTKVVMPAATTELAKLIDTTYYGLAIAFHGETKKWCDQLGLDFNIVMTEFNETYNEGYAKLGKTNVVRPVLKAPEGGIGGHCVVENATILKKSFTSKVLDIILDYKPKA